MKNKGRHIEVKINYNSVFALFSIESLPQENIKQQVKHKIAGNLKPAIVKITQEKLSSDILAHKCISK